MNLNTGDITRTAAQTCYGLENNKSYGSNKSNTPGASFGHDPYREKSETQIIFN